MISENNDIICLYFSRTDGYLWNSNIFCSYVFAAVSPAAWLLQVFLIVLSQAPLYGFESEKERSLALFGVCSQSQEYNKLCRMMWKNKKENVLVGFG